MTRVEPWYKQEGDAAGAAMTAAWRRVAGDSQPEKARFEMCLALSVDEPWLSLDNSTQYVFPWSAGGGTLRYNVIPSIQQTIHSELVQSKPRPMFLTEGAGWEDRERAKLANKWVDGLFYEAGVYDRINPQCVMDMLSFGMGIAKVFAVDGRVTVRRVFPWEVFVDSVDGRAGAPRVLYQVEVLDRDVARAMWPDRSEDIAEAPTSHELWQYANTSGADVVFAIEAWHLPSSEDAGDGRHIITIGNNVVVLDEEWTRDEFPFAVMRWLHRPIGWQGKGIPEQLASLQQSINKTALQIDLAQDAAAPVWVIRRDSKINKAKVSNMIGSIIEHDGNPPQFYAPTTTTPSMYQWFERQIQRAFELVGVSQLASQARIPRGMEGASGVALETYLDKGSARFVAAQSELEQFNVSIARLACAEMTSLAAEDKSYEVVYTRDGVVERVDWGKLELSEPFILKVWPTSLFPTTPAGKMKRLQDLMESGIAQALGMTQSTIQRLFDVPDLEAERMSAPRDVVDRMIARMLSEQDATIVPDPMFDLTMCLKQGMLHYAQGVADGMPEERLTLLRQWCSVAIGLMEQESEKAAPTPTDAATADPAATGAPIDPSVAGMPPEMPTELPPQEMLL